DAPTVIARIDAPQRERIEPVQPAALEAAHLDAVVAAGAAIHAAHDERAVADAAVDAIARASGFADVAFVGPELASDGQFHVISGRGAATAAPRLSRSVLARARLGAVIVSDAGGVADSHRTLADLRVSRVVCVPVELGTRFYGLIYLADGGAFRTPLEPVAALVRSVAAVSALALANIERLRTTARLEAEHRAMFDGTMQALIATIDAKDPYTRGHSARVAEFAHLLAVNAGLTTADAERARLCGLVHDIGKIGVSEEVLRKPGKLTDEEFLQIAAHPVIGHDILRGIPQMADVLPGVLCHHEKWAGGGYPHRIAGEEIPLLGRIIAIADAIDAMTTSRTYRGARPMTDAIAEITRCAGTHFDPRLAAVAASIDRRALQGIVGLHVFGPTPAASPAAAQMTCGASAPCTDTAGTTDTKFLLDARQDDRTRRTA
ncbi:MAG: HD domain-containing protein, partial [Proteobacteria bacterium]|nr:HD domain-containing protein [Pseudomonadota bacterium]